MDQYDDLLTYGVVFDNNKSILEQLDFNKINWDDVRHLIKCY